jgi:hypothetical protein
MQARLIFSNVPPISGATVSALCQDTLKAGLSRLAAPRPAAYTTGLKAGELAATLIADVRVRRDGGGDRDQQQDRGGLPMTHIPLGQAADEQDRASGELRCFTVCS